MDIPTSSLSGDTTVSPDNGSSSVTNSRFVPLTSHGVSFVYTLVNGGPRCSSLLPGTLKSVVGSDPDVRT